MGTPPCPQCRGASTWYAASNTFGCDRCRIPVASPAMMMHAIPDSGGGAIALRIVIFIVSVIIIVAVQFAVRAAIR